MSIRISYTGSANFNEDDNNCFCLCRNLNSIVLQIDIYIIYMCVCNPYCTLKSLEHGCKLLIYDCVVKYLHFQCKQLTFLI